MAKVFIEETTLSAIGDAIREKEGSTALVPVTEMASRIKNISSGGGIDWYALQEGGRRRSYPYTFAGNFWTEQNFKPEYDFKLEDGCEGMFAYSNIKGSISFEYNYTIKEWGSIPRMFYASAFTEIYAPRASGFSEAFTYCHELKKLTVSCGEMRFGDFSKAFKECYNLEDLTFEGLIDCGTIDLRDCSKLNKNSIKGVIQHLAYEMHTIYFSKTAVENAFGVNSDGDLPSEWYNLIASGGDLWSVYLI